MTIYHVTPYEVIVKHEGKTKRFLNAKLEDIEAWVKTVNK